MTKLYNKKSLKPIRKALRHNMPKAEVLLWNEIKNRQINGFKFRRQYSFDKYVVDFYCPELRLAIEVDGETHSTPEELLHDIARQDEIEKLGVRFLRFSNDDIYESLDGVIETITETTHQRSVQTAVTAD